MNQPATFTHGIKEVEPGVRLHYVQAGEGPRTLVLIHGFPETWWQWRHVMPVFADAGFRVIAVDYRGAGNSSKPPGGYDKQTMARDIHTLVVDQLGITSPVQMVGHDLGMKVAFAYAALFADAIEKLVLVDAIIPGAKHFHDLLSTGRLANFDLAHFFFHNAKNNIAETLTAGRERVYIQDFFNRHAYNIGAFPPDVIDVYAKAYAAPGGMRAAFEVYRAFDQDGQDNAAVFANGGRLRTPTLFVVGLQSGFLSTVAKDIVDEIAENGSFVGIPDSGHYPAEENPTAFAEAVLAFCQTTGAPLV
ncbi:alpha/beta fold hydrolase [Rhizosaccharibacter radicis]|uniref:Alpha/beta hydrolase n=1 Tax=Rhizosaccharibacter radicis TaxID=2782605 RepID=A0ABT1VWU0_9PROT|nr:alpha/beta hydrolase [Acetobacteraceae bacterium KSS12]